MLIDKLFNLVPRLFTWPSRTRWRSARGPSKEPGNKVANCSLPLHLLFPILFLFLFFLLPRHPSHQFMSYTHSHLPLLAFPPPHSPLSHHLLSTLFLYPSHRSLLPKTLFLIFSFLPIVPLRCSPSFWRVACWQSLAVLSKLLFNCAIGKTTTTFLS